MKQSIIWCLCTLICLGGCAQEERIAPTVGRIDITTQPNIIPMNLKAQGNATLGQQQHLFSWSQSGVTGQNKIPHTMASEDLKLVWDTNIGKGLDSNHWGIAQPIADKGIVYTLDADFKLSAVNLKNGKTLWKKGLTLNNPTAIKTIGLVYTYSTLIAVSGNGTIVCLNLNGDELWRKELNLPIRSQPMVYKNVLYLLSANNQLIAFNTTTGNEVWQYKGMATQTNLMGMGVPALYKEYAVIPFSNGEVITFNTSDKEILWTEYLSATRSFNHISDLTHILASPVIEEGIVYLVGNAGKMGAYRLENGENVWTLPMGGANTPVISGSTLFVINNKNVLTAINKYTGKVYWTMPLISHDTEEHASWKGPLLVGNDAIITSSNGDIIFVDAKSGQEKHRLETDGIVTAPINVDGTVLFLTEDADLLAYR